MMKPYLFSFLERTKTLPGDIACMGIYRGRTLVGMASYLPDKRIYAFDSFKGFPPYHKNDLPIMFNELYERGEITLDHLLKVRPDIRHLTSERWGNCSKKQVMGLLVEKGLNKVRIYEGMFKDTLHNLPDELCFVLMDCDLYESYLTALSHCYARMVKGGVIFLDEYYSLKYPGARVAVNEFFSDKPEKPERIGSDSFERWCVKF